MGNEVGKNNSRLGVSAMAFTTPNIEKDELLALTKKMQELVKAAPVSSNDTNAISKSQVEDALKAITKFEPSDVELFTSIFTMMDNAGENIINYREYMSGISGCLVSGVFMDKLDFAFTIYDVEETGELSRADMKKVLNALNNVASFFGDPVMTSEQIDSAVIDIFKNNGPSPVMSRVDGVNLAATHNTTELLLLGRGTVRYGR